MPLNGSAISSLLDTSQQAMSTSDQLSMFDLTTCGPIVSATSSPASADGATPCGLPDGMMIDLFGQVLAPASPSAPPERARRPMTDATCGLRGFLSSASAALQSCLESKLRRRLDGAGSTLFSLIWKRKATPAGRPYYQLVASGRRTSGSDYGSWPTPNAGPQNDSDSTWQQRRAELKAQHINGNGFGMTLGQASQLTSWPTPTLHDAERGGQAKRAMGKTRHGSNLQDFALTAWMSPAASDGKGKGGPNAQAILRGNDNRLSDQAGKI